MTRQDDQARRALRQIRRDQDQTWRTWPRRVAAAVVRGLTAIFTGVAWLVRTVVEFFLELFGELILGVLALALFAGVVALGVWGWGKSPAATIVLAAGLLAFLALGAYQYTADHKNRVIAVASGSALFVVIWLAYVLQYY
ncbi:hypothetical protein [Actinokineospora sp. HUAS TT18]|uniref:hypothetical protein n=1 Tax=Actinokineospora sp. HUAS TT18 TaxID=3447451 RepID=UPI003F51D3A7